MCLRRGISTMEPFDLIRIAEQLASGAIGSGVGRPRQAELRRAVSAAYYAMFHALARCCADTLVGTSPARRNRQAWRRTYRALEHGFAKNQCANQSALHVFPPQIQRFGELFVIMQQLRHAADYDPDPDPETDFDRSHILQLIAETSRAITSFQSADVIDRRAFATFVLMRTRRN